MYGKKLDFHVSVVRNLQRFYRRSRFRRRRIIATAAAKVNELQQAFSHRCAKACSHCVICAAISNRYKKFAEGPWHEKGFGKCKQHCFPLMLLRSTWTQHPFAEPRGSVQLGVHVCWRKMFRITSGFRGLSVWRSPWVGKGKCLLKDGSGKSSGLPFVVFVNCLDLRIQAGQVSN